MQLQIRARGDELNVGFHLVHLLDQACCYVAGDIVRWQFRAQLRIIAAARQFRHFLIFGLTQDDMSVRIDNHCHSFAIARTSSWICTAPRSVVC